MNLFNNRAVCSTLRFLDRTYGIRVTAPVRGGGKIDLTRLSRQNTRQIAGTFGYSQETLARGLEAVLQLAVRDQRSHRTTVDLDAVLEGRHNQLAVLFDSFGGESGKGKTAEWLLRDGKFDLCVRHHSGPNCGYATRTDKGTIELATIPVGINVPGVVNLISNGSVFNPLLALKELRFLTDNGLIDEAGAGQRLQVSEKAHLIFPYHRLFREAQRTVDDKFSGVAIGVGPAYSDKVGRVGIQIAEMLNDQKEALARLTRNCLDYNRRMSALGSKYKFDPEKIFRIYLAALTKSQSGGMLIPNSTTFLLEQIAAGKKIFFQGVQGLWADMDHGFVPFHTSASTLPGNIATYAAVPLQNIAAAGFDVYQVAKAYVTGNDCPTFPTLLDQESSVAKALRVRGKEWEYNDEYLRDGPYVINPMRNASRPNLIGWFDLVAFEYGRRIAGSTQGVITKLDVLSGLDRVPVCIGYKRPTGSRLAAEIGIGEFDGALPLYKTALPVYCELPGWKEDISLAKTFGELPANAQRYLAFISRKAHLPIGLVSVGPSSEQTFRVPPSAW